MARNTSDSAREYRESKTPFESWKSQFKQWLGITQVNSKCRKLSKDWDNICAMYEQELMNIYHTAFYFHDSYMPLSDLIDPEKIGSFAEKQKETKKPKKQNQLELF